MEQKKKNLPEVKLVQSSYAYSNVEEAAVPLLSNGI